MEPVKIAPPPILHLFVEGGPATTSAEGSSSIGSICSTLSMDSTCLMTLDRTRSHVFLNGRTSFTEALNVIRNQIIRIISSSSPLFESLDVTLVGLLGTLRILLFLGIHDVLHYRNNKTTTTTTKKESITQKKLIVIKTFSHEKQSVTQKS